MAIASAIACVAAAAEAGRQVDGEVLFIAPVINDNAYYFSIDEVESLAVAANAGAFAYQSVGSAVVGADSFDVFTRMVHTNGAYFELGSLQFLHGGGWTPDREAERVAVINESLAWQLFGNVRAVGNSVSVMGDEYAVVGVIRQGRVSKDGGVIYIPMDPSPGERRISSVFLKIGGDRLGARSGVSGAFPPIGKNPMDYYITDIGRYVENIALNYKILVFVAGVYAALVIAVNSHKLHKRGRTDGKNLIFLAGLLLADVIMIALLIRGVSFDVWIPHGGGSRLGDIVGAVTNNGALPSAEYLSDGLKALARQNANSNTALAVGLAALFNFIFVHRAA